MGIYDREYYRRDGPSFLGSIASRGKVCKYLILANVICFVIQLLTMQTDGIRGGRFPGWFTELFALNVDKVLHGEVWRLLTGAFLHSEFDILHILFNMLFLWWFGSDVEDVYGPREFLAIYLGGAIASSLAFVAGNVAGFNSGIAIGASGAVMTVTTLCALHFPTRTILVFFVLPVPIWAFVVFLVAQDLFGFLGGGHGRGIAFSGHLGGAAFALLYYKSHIRITSLLPDLQAWNRRRNRPRLRVYREEGEAEKSPVAVPVGPRNSTDEQLEARVDAVLEKVARSGKESLTETERQILMRASEIYKRRRT